VPHSFALKPSPVSPRIYMTVLDRTSFVLKMAEALHRYGHPAHRLEESLAATSKKLGLEAQFFSTPTSIFASFGPCTHCCWTGRLRSHSCRVYYCWYPGVWGSEVFLPCSTAK